ncbi:hypothetical protein MC28_E136 (plasmid) [Bacillus thuringiensis MC28]|nr:hypothetical protein MC28_E136 [Bacillus thuringiensis MC28]
MESPFMCVRQRKKAPTWVLFQLESPFYFLSSRSLYILPYVSIMFIDKVINTAFPTFKSKMY